MNQKKRTPRAWYVVEAVFFLTVARFLFIHRPNAPVPVPKTPHFEGLHTWIYQGIALEGSSEGWAKEAREIGYTGVVVKAWDGAVWGTKVHGAWKSQFTEVTVGNFHRQGIRCYAFGTTYLLSATSVRGQIANAEKALHRGADGVVLDDVFVYGANRALAQELFGGLDYHIKTCGKCRGKVLAFSTHPHHIINANWRLPWEVPLRHCKYFLPQTYWLTLRLTPEETWRYARGSFIAVAARKRIPEKALPVIVPVGQAYEETVKPKDLADFFSAVYPYCKGAGVYRQELVGDKTAAVIRDWSGRYAASRGKLEPLSNVAMAR